MRIEFFDFFDEVLKLSHSYFLIFMNEDVARFVVHQHL